MFKGVDILDLESAVVIAKFYVENCKGLSKEDVAKKLIESKMVILQDIDDAKTKKILNIQVVLKRSSSFCEKLEKVREKNAESFFDNRSA